MQCFFYLLYFYYQIAENIIKINKNNWNSGRSSIQYKGAIRGMLTEMKNNPGRFKGKRILYIHTGTIFHHCLPPSDVVFNLCFLSLIKSLSNVSQNTNYLLVGSLRI